MVVKRRAAKHCKYEMDYDYRSNQQGAWKAKDDLKRKSLIIENRDWHNHGKSYTLTLKGARVCKELFERKFHPSINPEYELIEPRHGHVGEDGEFHPGQRPFGASFTTPTASRSGGGRFGGLVDAFPAQHRAFDLHDDDDRVYDENTFGMSVNRYGAMKNSQVHIAESSKPEQDLDTIRRQRMLRFDPALLPKLQKLIAEMGCSEMEAWTLYENGALDRTISSSSKAPANIQEDDLDEAIALSLSLAQSSKIPSNRAEDRGDEAAALAASIREIEEEEKRWAEEAKFYVDSDSGGDDDDPDLKEAIAASLRNTPVATPVAFPSRHCSSSSRASREASNTRSAWGAGKAILECIEEDEEQIRESATSRLTAGKEIIAIDLIEDETDCKPSCSRGEAKDCVFLLDDDDNDDGEVDAGKVIDICQDDTQPLDEDIIDQSHAPGKAREGPEEKKSAPVVYQSVSAAASTLYVVDCVPDEAELCLFVDVRERLRENAYRSFFKDVENEHKLRIPEVFAWEKTLPLGDFALGCMMNMPNLACDKRNRDNCWLAGLLVERKRMDDLKSRSSEKGEGAHFRQERQLRQSGFSHAFLLLEGDYITERRSAPRVSREEDLSRIDVIQDGGDLAGYICGLLCRNYDPSYAVRFLHTINAKESAVLLTALSAMFRHLFAAQVTEVKRMPTLSSVVKYWSSHSVAKRKTELMEFLSSGQISEEMQMRVWRRFGDKPTLLHAYSGCQTALQQSRLLMGLSSAGANGSAEAMEEEQDVVQRHQHFESDSKHVAQLISSTAATTWLSYRRTVEVYVDENMGNLLQSPRSDGDVTFAKWKAVCSSTDALSSASFCEIVVKERMSCSRALLLVALPGEAVVEALAAAYEALGASRRVDEAPARFHSRVAVHATEQLYARCFPPPLQRRLQALDAARFDYQLVCLVENVGHGSGVVGALGKLARRMNALQSQARVERTAPVAVQLDADRPAFSHDAGQYVNINPQWHLSLFCAAMALRHRWQVIHTVKDSGGATEPSPFTAEAFVWKFIHEMRRQSLLQHGCAAYPVP